MRKNKLNSIRKIVLFVAPLAFFGCYHSLAAPTQGYTQSQNVPEKVNEETVKVLQKITQYEIDESYLISQCLDNLSNQSLKDKLQAICKECSTDIKELSNLLVKYGGKIPDYSKDFKGYFMSGYAAMRGFNEQGALKALHTNLKLISKAFESSLSSAAPAEVKEAINKAYENNKKAIQTIEAQI